jgi:hypothetical protein
VERERARPSTTPGKAFSSPRALEPSQLGAQEEVRGGWPLRMGRLACKCSPRRPFLPHR